MNNKKIKNRNRKSKKNKITIEIIAISILVLLFSGIGIYKFSSNSVSDNSASEDIVLTGEVIDISSGFGDMIDEIAEESEERLPTQIVAHRGYCSVAPENTMQAFVRGIDADVDMIELDVQLTKDGYIVVFHDLNLSRIVGDKKSISDYTYAELLDMDFGSYKSTKFTGLSDQMKDACYKGERIITLDQVLAYFSGEYYDGAASDIIALVGDVPDGVLINLELKDLTNYKGISQAQKDTFAAAVVSRVYAYGLQDRVVFASFNQAYLDTIESLNSDNYTLCVTEEGEADMLLEKRPADSYSIDLNVVTDDTITRLHAAGKPVYVWTANTADMMRYALSLDADGIITNYPGIASVLIHDEYSYMIDNYIGSYTAPAIYDYSDMDVLGSYVMSGFTIVDPSRKSIIETDDKKDEKNEGKKETKEDDEDKDIPVDPLMVISAYDIDGAKDSILYVMSMEGVLLNIIDLGIKGDMNSLAYDADHNILWISCRDEYIYALDWEDICNGNYGYDIASVREDINKESDKASAEDSDAGSIIAMKTLYKASDICDRSISSVSFIAYEAGYLYIGSGSGGSKLYKASVADYIDNEDDNGEEKDDENLESEDIVEPNPYVIELVDTYDIPDNIEGVTFGYEAVIDNTSSSAKDKKDDELDVTTYMVMTRRNIGENMDSELISIVLEDGRTDYSSGYEVKLIPERAMQPFVQDDKLYLPFQSASRPYLHTSRVLNDQIWVVDWGRS